MAAALRLAVWTALLVPGGALLLVAAVLWPMNPERYTAIDASGEVLDRSGQTLQAFLSADEKLSLSKVFGTALRKART